MATLARRSGFGEARELAPGGTREATGVREGVYPARERAWAQYRNGDAFPIGHGSRGDEYDNGPWSCPSGYCMAVDRCNVADHFVDCGDGLIERPGICVPWMH